MKKFEILELLKPFQTSQTEIKDLNADITDVTTNLQLADEREVVFYRLGPTDRDREAFYQRLTNSRSMVKGLIVLSSGSEDFQIDNIIYIPHQDFLKVQKIILDHIYPNKNSLKIVGITGTNGKTTTSNLAMSLAMAYGKKAISVGTIGIFDQLGPLAFELDATTPSYVEIRKIIHHYQDDYDACFMEISSHALVQDRLYDLKLHACGFTSFSQDHLDYHQTMDEYLKAKVLIATKYSSQRNKVLVPENETELIGKLQSIRMDSNEHLNVVTTPTLSKRGINPLQAPLFFRPTYNQSNLELAMALVEELWGQFPMEKFNLNSLSTPKGRFSIVEFVKPSHSFAIIDYAHTADALQNIGKAIREAYPEYSVTTLFGCGGNRDRTKRPLMGASACEFSDKIIVTTDNPRFEKPEKIIQDIIPGMTKKYHVEIDREKAIRLAINEAREFEIILIAGKGHEEYQEIEGIRYPFSDFSLVKKIVEGQ